MTNVMQGESKNSMQEVNIVPAVLPRSLEELEDGLQTLHGVAPLVQIDVVKDIFGIEESLPLWEEFDFEFDIYLEPLGFIDRALELGASRVVVHARHKSALQVIEQLQSRRGGNFPVAVGVGLRPTDTDETVVPYLSSIDFVQVMGIDNEGNQGEPFDPLAVGLIRALRAAHQDLFIQVDGAAAGHVKELVNAGASRLIVGSAILHADNPKAVYKQLYTEANVH